MQNVAVWFVSLTVDIVISDVVVNKKIDTLDSP